MSYAVTRCQFCETKLSHQALKRSSNSLHECRSKLQCLNRLIVRFRAMKRIGIQMSNACYTLASKSFIPADAQDTLKELYEQWDVAKRS